MLEIISVPIAEIIPYKNNPKEHPQEQIDQIAESIRDFKMNDPIAIDEENVIIEGHGRLLALKQMGEETAPCIRLSHLTEEQKRAYSIAHNKLTINSGFDLEKLQKEFAFLQQSGFDLLATGFTADELAGCFADNSSQEVKDDGFDVGAELEKPCISQKGDIWELGKHRLINGDSTDKANMSALLIGNKVNLVVTDPPYNVDYVGATKEHLKIQNDKMSDHAFYKFLYDFLKLTKASMTDKASIYMFHSQSESINFHKVFAELEFHRSDMLIWKKNSIVLGRSPYQRMYEGILYGWKENGGHEWFSDRKQTNVLEFDRPVRSDDHPTMKPIPLIAYLIQNSSKAGYAVLDPFGGSGSTLIACEQTGRVCSTSELEPKYCDVIVKRYIEQSKSTDGVFITREGKWQSYNNFIKNVSNSDTLTGGEAVEKLEKLESS
jgi:DNA modification methylase